MNIKSIEEFIFPCRCAACGVVYKNLFDLPFCPICSKKWNFAKQSLENRNHGLPAVIIDDSLPPEHGGVLSSLVGYHSYTLERGFEIGKQVIFALKQSGTGQLDKFIADELFERIKTLKIPISKQLAVVSIPRNPKNYRKVGVDNMKLIGKLLASKLGAQYLPALKQKRRTMEQKSLNHVERFKNADGKFTIADKTANQLRGKSVILIDDVVTTGATLCSAMHCLLNYGDVKRVYIFAVAGNERIIANKTADSKLSLPAQTLNSESDNKFDTAPLWD